MSSVYIDLILIIILVFGFLIGFKRGFTRQLVSLLGIFGILIISYLFKRPLSIFLANKFPIIKVNEFSDINILIYDGIAFILIFFIFSIIFRILVKLTNVFEKILKATIVLSIPSKILGGLLGLIENYILIFIVLTLLSLPIFNINIDSKLGNCIRYRTPFINNINIKKADINKIKKKYQNIDIDKETRKILDNMYK